VKIDIPKMGGYHDEWFIYGGRRWLVGNLIQLAQDLPVFDLPLVGLDLRYSPWLCEDIAGFLFHVQRLQDCNLDFPVIQGAEGHIMNGWHRVCKAILNGDESVKAVRFTMTPAADLVDDKQGG
jgi:hypothetical protein